MSELSGLSQPGAQDDWRPAWAAAAYDDLSVRARPDRVAVVTLDLPDRRNLMSDAMTASWARLMTALAADTELRCVVVTGAGPAFCAGGDVSWLASLAGGSTSAGAADGATVDALRTRMLSFYRSWLTIRQLEVPTIAAVNGAAIGAGLALALACDLRYAADDATLAVPFTSLGLHPGMATTWLLPDVVGLAVARELLLTGRVVTGAEAQRLGLVAAAVPRERVLEHALEVAGQVAAAAPVATRLTTVALRAGGHAGLQEALQWEALAQPVTLATEDLQEGLAARRERRPPRFTGR
ncbi:MAG TPA: enoyl-CoA hydratase-related protein [Motilibacteraceae bacterium]|nr:enoyl-CoA hydratase-related protein [Motilibacteraceae bacterium]